MGLFSGIKNTYKKSEAAVLIEKLAEHQNRLGTFGFEAMEDPKFCHNFANLLITNIWETKPDVYNGKFGQRPHKIAVAAALGYYIDTVRTNRKTDVPSYTGAVLSLTNLLNELEVNGALYPLSDMDWTLINTSMEAMKDASIEFEEKHGDLLKELDFLNE